MKAAPSYEEQFITDLAAALRGKLSDKKQMLRGGRVVRNEYAAAKRSRLTSDWTTQIDSPTTVLRMGLRTLRARSRDIAINNDHARAFLWMLAKHVSGPHGIGMQNKAKRQNGVLDKTNNDKIEAAWEEWNKKGNFDVTGTLSGADADRLFIQTVGRDGECLIRFVENYDNDWGFAVQFLEADHLDENLNIARLQNGNSIRMGVEFNGWMRPVAYHLLTTHPGDFFWQYGERKYYRLPAAEIEHAFIRERYNQPRGVPWMHSAMKRLNNIGAYEEAAIIGARIGASAMGIWEPDPMSFSNEPPVADDETMKSDDDEDTPLIEFEPGIFVKAPYGYKFKEFDPSQPSGEFAPFIKASLRGVSSGLLVSYNSLSGDLEGVNFSSIRAGLLEERDMWKLLQAWMIQNYKQAVFDRWFRWAILTGKLNIPLSRAFEVLKRPKWTPRTWAWVDPLKETQANIMQLDNLLTTRTDLAAEQGEDFEEMLIKLKEEKQLMEKYGVAPVDKTGEKKSVEKSGEKSDDEADNDDDDERELASRGNGKGAW